MDLTLTLSFQNCSGRLDLAWDRNGNFAGGLDLSGVTTNHLSLFANNFSVTFPAPVSGTITLPAQLAQRSGALVTGGSFTGRVTAAWPRQRGTPVPLLAGSVLQIDV
jgi:hypothetical protein